MSFHCHIRDDCDAFVNRTLLEQFIIESDDRVATRTSDDSCACSAPTSTSASASASSAQCSAYEPARTATNGEASHLPSCESLPKHAGDTPRPSKIGEIEKSTTQDGVSVWRFVAPAADRERLTGALAQSLQSQEPLAEREVAPHCYEELLPIGYAVQVVPPESHASHSDCFDSSTDCTSTEEQIPHAAAVPAANKNGGVDLRAMSENTEKQDALVGTPALKIEHEENNRKHSGVLSVCEDKNVRAGRCFPAAAPAVVVAAAAAVEEERTSAVCNADFSDARTANSENGESLCYQFSVYAAPLVRYRVPVTHEEFQRITTGSVGIAPALDLLCSRIGVDQSETAGIFTLDALKRHFHLQLQAPV